MKEKDLQGINVVNLYYVFNNEYKEILKKYNIFLEDKNYSKDEYEDFLKSTNKMEISDMEKIYDRLDDYFIEQDFISHFSKSVKITMKSGNTIIGHCETFTRSIDSDYDEPELTIATKDGYIGVRYSEVDKVEDI